MEWLTIIYLFYLFVALYFLSLYALTYFQNKGKIYFVPSITKKYSLTMVVPCYNEEKDIEKTVVSLINAGYSNLKRIIVVDDCSTDNSYQIIKGLAKKYPLVMAVQTPKNTGKASGAKNYGAQFAETDLIGFTDADSFPEKGSIEKMIGFFDDTKTAAVTSMVLVNNKENWITKLQAIEYRVIAFTRKLLGFLEAIYVTPGPLAIYRKNIFEEVGGFDEKNMTEDIEITWNFVKHGYKVEMSAPSHVFTVAPKKFLEWFKQRLRWNIGGIQTIRKYKSSFLGTGMLGLFILPFFVFSWSLGIVGLSVFIYRMVNFILAKYLITSYSVGANVALLSFQDINLVPNVLYFFGLAIFVLGLGFTLISLLNTPEKGHKVNVFWLACYILFYLSAYPIILLISLYKVIRGKYSW